MDYRKKLDGNINVQKKINSAFSKGSLSFLCASSDEKNSEKLKKAECEQKYKLNINEYRKLTAEKWKTMDASSKKKLVAERGITLLTLVITVVIMIILAAVTINVTLGEGGLVDQAKWAAEQTANSTQSEQEQLENVASQINDIIAGIGSGGSDTNSTGGEDTNSVETNSMDTNSVEETNSIDTNSVEETNTVDTNTIAPDPVPDPLPDGTITIGEPQWQPDGTANVTVSTTEPDVTIEYQIGGTDEDSWLPVEDGTIENIENGETVYVRITDGEQSSNPQNKKIEDATAPEKANIEVNPTSVLVGESLTATVTHIDNETGVDTSASKWVMNQSATEIGTDDTSAYIGSFATNPDTITLDSSNAGVYYLHVLTTDIAGNKTETVSEAITISAITGTVSQNGSISWNAGQATLVLQTTESQYTIVYKINGQGSWQVYNGASITGLSHGDTVTACLTNASQTTYGPEAEFEIQDTISPTVTVTAQGSPSTNSITVTAQAVDNESGMKAEPTYTFQYKTSEAGSYTTPSGASNITNAQYTFTGLTQGTTYDIQVIVNEDNAGNTGTGTTQATTTTVPGADEGLQTGTITASPVTWSNYKASTTLTTTETGFQIQYQVNGTSESGWSSPANSPVTVSNLDHGDTVYARLWDGNNGGNYAAINILDGTPPTISNLSVSNITYNSFTVTVTASDGQSGLATTATYKYYINNGTSPRYTSTSNRYTYSSLTMGRQYPVRVVVTDKAGNTAERSTTATTNDDTTSPNSASIQLSSTRVEVGQSITATVTQTDNQSGVDISECKWVLNTSSSNNLSESSFTGSFSTATNAKISLTPGQVGTYYLHVLTVDNAGNTRQTVSEAMEFFDYITFTTQHMFDSGTTEQFTVPRGTTWNEFINELGGDEYGFWVSDGYVYYSYNTYGAIVCNDRDFYNTGATDTIIEGHAYYYV